MSFHKAGDNGQLCKVWLRKKSMASVRFQGVAVILYSPPHRERLCPLNLPSNSYRGSFPFLSRVYRMLQQDEKKWDSMVVSRSVENEGSQKKDGNIRMFPMFRQNGRHTCTVRIYC
jgi:hypothetical protein